MKSLAEFKRAIVQAKEHGILLKTTLFNHNRVAIRLNEFAPVQSIQSNAFSLQRQVESWVRFGKAGDWIFQNHTILQKQPDGGYLQFEFNSCLS